MNRQLTGSSTGSGRRPLWHFLSVVFIIAAACLLFYKSFPPHGMLMYTDMTWPNTLSRLQFSAANTWMPYGSFPTGAVYQLWFYWIYPSATLARFLHIPASAYMFIMFLGTFSLAGISMYALAYSTINSIKLPDKARYAPYIGAVIAAIVFMYNPWSLMYLRAYFAYPVYALSPLLFLAIAKTLDSPTVKNIILLSLFVVLINTSHHLLWFWGLFVSYLLFFIITNRFKKEKVLGALKVLGGVGVLYFLLGATWIAPYLGSRLAGKPLLPYYAPSFSSSSIRGLSVNNHLMNNFRLVGFWSWSLKMLKGGVFVEVLLFALPVMAVLSFLLMRKRVKGNRTVNYWAIAAALALILGTGTSSILRRYYLYVTTRAPGAGSYGWMLRAPEKWLFFVPVFYALMIGILVMRLLENGGGRRNLTRLTAAVTVVLVIASLCPVALWCARTYFNPADVPRDYRQVNDFLAGKPDGTRVIWMPFFSSGSFAYKWAPGKRIGAYSILSSNPSLNNIQECMNDNSYYIWLGTLYLKKQIPQVSLMNPELVLKRNEMASLFAPFGARYLIFDTSVKGYNFGDSFDREKSLKLVYRTKYLRVYRIAYDPGYITTAAPCADVNSFFDNLSVIQNMLGKGLQIPAFFDGQSFFGGPSTVDRKFGLVDINSYLIPLTPYGGFEKSKANGQPEGWYVSYDNGKSEVSLVKDTRAEGRRSLRVVNRSSRRFDISWISTWEEPVQAGDIYTLKTNMKCRNANWSTVTIEGYRTDTGRWVPLISCPGVSRGNSGWRRYHCSLCVPEGMARIRPSLGAGWKEKRRKGPAITWFDGVELSKVKNEFITDIVQKETPAQVSYKKVSAEEYRVRVRGARRPFLLTLAETYDGLWTAETGDPKKIEPVPMYKTINAFPIDKTGDFEVTVRYRLQHWLSAGLAVSFVTLLICILCLLYLWRAKLSARAIGIWKRARNLIKIHD